METSGDLNSRMEKYYTMLTEVGLWFQIYFSSNNIFHKLEVSVMVKPMKNKLLFSATLISHSHATETKLN